jgi:exodeoxyribonuclease-3
MKIISWNVNGLRAMLKKDGFNWLLNENPDIFCLQETKAEAGQLPPDVVNPPGYKSYFESSKTRKGYSGVAVFTKFEPKKVEYGLGRADLDQEGRFLGLFFDKFALFNVYFPNGGGAPERLTYKLSYYEAFLKYIEKVRKTQPNIIFCGDVNVAHNEIDIARPKENVNHVGFLPVERAWMDKVIAANYVDTWRALHPETKNKYTYWDIKTFARERNVGWRIDYFFSSIDFFPKITDSVINEDVLGSDHCPITLSLEL